MASPKQQLRRRPLSEEVSPKCSPRSLDGILLLSGMDDEDSLKMDSPYVNPVARSPKWRKPITLLLYTMVSAMLLFCYANSDFNAPPQQPVASNVHANIAPGDSSRLTSISNAITRIKARNAYLCTENTDISQWRRKTGGPPRFHGADPMSGQIISLLSPVYSCPWTLHRTNYVSESQFDGGKWTCGLKEMQAARRNNNATQTHNDNNQKHNNIPCVVYSFGSNGDDFFEADVHRWNPECEIHIFDPTSGDPPVEWADRYHFHKEGLCVGNETSFSLDDRTAVKGDSKHRREWPCKNLRGHMNALGHRAVDIFKADVEGMEWNLTAQWPEDLDRIGQILLEFHFWVQRPYLPKLLREHVIPLERLGYFIQTIEPVAAEIEAFEITFLNVNWNVDGTFGNEYRKEMYPVTPGVVL